MAVDVETAKELPPRRSLLRKISQQLVESTKATMVTVSSVKPPESFRVIFLLVPLVAIVYGIRYKKHVTVLQHAICPKSCRC